MENMGQLNNDRLVSIIIPAYNEAGGLHELWARLRAVLDRLSEYSFEIIFIDNCSKDKTYEIACGLANSDSRWKCFRMARNFGAEASLAAGLTFSNGNAAIFLYSDLQEPPEMIPVMLTKWQQGFDIVYGIVEGRSDDSVYKYIGSKMFHYLIAKFSEVDIPNGASDFRLLSRRCINVINTCKEKSRYLRGLTHWVGFKQTSFSYVRASRTNGTSTTNLWFLANYAINAITCFSTKPLKLASVVGILCTLSSFILAVLYLTLACLSTYGLINLTPPPAGWTTQTLLIIFFGGLNCFFLGVIGTYLARIYDETRNRPIWVLADSYSRETQPICGG